MRKINKKKIVAGAITIFTLSLICILPVRADDGAIEALLTQISKATQDTAKYAYEIDQYVQATLTKLQSWLLPDDSETTSKVQGTFSNYTKTTLQDINDVTNLQPQLSKAFFGDGLTKDDAPNLNDLTFQTLLGKPFFDPDPRAEKNKDIDPAYNYLKNAAGINLIRPFPQSSWTGSELDKARYQTFYNTISAVQTYNFYVLSQLYSGYKNGNSISEQQNKLIQEASNSTWFAEIASENIGFVLRQILMYNSQTLVLLNQLLQTQKQLLATQAMANTLAILNNQSNESILINKAAGITK